MVLAVRPHVWPISGEMPHTTAVGQKQGPAIVTDDVVRLKAGKLGLSDE